MVVFDANFLIYFLDPEPQILPQLEMRLDPVEPEVSANDEEA